MKIAMYKTGANTRVILEASEYMETSPHYLRVSDIVDVEFAMLDIEPQFDSLKAEENAATREYMDKIAEIGARRQALRQESR